MSSYLGNYSFLLSFLRRLSSCCFLLRYEYIEPVEMGVFSTERAGTEFFLVRHSVLDRCALYLRCNVEM